MQRKSLQPDLYELLDQGEEPSGCSERLSSFLLGAFELRSNHLRPASLTPILLMLSPRQSDKPIY